MQIKMKKILFILMIICSGAMAQQISNLTTTTTGTTSDFLIKNDASPAATKKITVANFISTYSLTTSGTTGSGTINFIPLWSSSTAFTNSYLSQSGRNIKLPASRFITSYDTLGCQIDLSYSGQRKSFNISTDGGADNQAWVYGDSVSLQLGYNSNTGVTLTNTTASLSNNQGAHSINADSSINIHTAIVSLKAPLIRATGTFAVKDGNQAVGKIFTCTNATIGAGTWQTLSGTISGLTTGTLPIATSSSTLGNSSLSQTSGDVYIAATKKFYDATGVNFIDLFDGGNGITIDADGNDITMDGTAACNALTSISTISTDVGIVAGASTVADGYLTLKNASNSNTVTLKSGATGSTIQYVLPTTDPTAGQVLSASAPSAGISTLSWASALTNSLTSTRFLVGNGSNVATAVNMSGDASLANTGAVTVSAIGGKSVTLGGNLTMSGAFGFTGTITANTAVTFPTTGTLATLAGTETFTNKSITSPTVTVGSDATGDIYYNGGSGVLTRLADVSAGSYLRSGGTSTAPLWSTLKLPNSATANYIPYATSSNTFGESSSLQFNGTSLGIGMAPTEVLDITRNQNASSYIQLLNSNGGTASATGLILYNGTNVGILRLTGTGYTPSGIYKTSGLTFVTDGAGGFGCGATNAAGFITFYSGGTTERMRLDASGNLGIGTTTVSAKLHIVSTTEQSRLGYDASNYYSTTIGSTGAVTLDAVGSGSAFAIQDKVTLNNPIKLKAYTVATLPAGVVGDVAYVTDATAPTYGAMLVGGGAVVTIAFYDGTNWTAH